MVRKQLAVGRLRRPLRVTLEPSTRTTSVAPAYRPIDGRILISLSAQWEPSAVFIFVSGFAPAKLLACGECLMLVYLFLRTH